MTDIHKIADVERAARAPELPWSRFAVTGLDETECGVSSALVSRLSLADYRGARDHADTQKRLRALAERFHGGAAARLVPGSGKSLYLDPARESLTISHGADWFGGRSTWTQVFNAMNGANIDQAKRVRDLADELAPHMPPVPSRRRRREWTDDEPEDFDPDRIIDWHERPGSRRIASVRHDPGVVHLVATFGGSCATSAEQLAWTGAPALAVARVLMDAGYSVSLDAVLSPKAQSREASASMLCVRILDAGAAIEADDAALASVVCDAGTFRTLGFLCGALSDPDLGSNFGRYGTNPARIYQAVAATGALPVPLWCFESSYSRDAALKSAKSGLAAILDHLAPESVLSHTSQHEAATAAER